MAITLPTYEAQASVQPMNAPRISLDTSIGDALQSAGNAITNASERALAFKRQKENLDASLGLDRLNAELDRDFAETVRTAPADGTGIEQSFTQKYLTPKTDAFLNTIGDPQLKDKFRKQIDVYRLQQGNKANDAEYKIGNDHSVNAVKQFADNASRAIVADPTNYDAIIKDMDGQIDAAPLLTSAQREEMKQKWRQAAPAILAETLQNSDPETLYYATGKGTPEKRIGYLSKALVKAVAIKESSSGRNLISPKGALGAMQIMPETAIEIAQELGDQAFLQADDEVRKRMLLSDSVSYRYGEHYLGKMLKQNGGDLQLALIAYNAGQARADEFKASGGDWSQMGKWAKETQPYVADIMRMLGTKVYAGMPSQAYAGPVRTLPIKYANLPGRMPVNPNHMDARVTGAYERLQGVLGYQVPVVSAFRDPVTNKAAKGAKGSQHLHGTALDLDVSRLPHAERLKLIQTASALGFTGIGVYPNSIHIDMRQGGKAIWGPSHHADTVPDWAQQTLLRHMSGGFSSPALAAQGGAGAGEGARGVQPSPDAAFIAAPFANISPSVLLDYQAKSAAAINRGNAATAAELDTLKFQTRAVMENDIASMMQTGRGSVPTMQIEDFEQQLLRAHGADAVLGWGRDRARAAAVYETSKGFAAMPDAQIDGVVQSLTPQGGATAEDQQFVYERVKERAAAVKEARNRDPAIYAITNDRQVAAAWQRFNPADPATASEAIGLTVRAQEAMGILIDKINPLPGPQADAVARGVMNPEANVDNRIGVLAGMVNVTSDPEQQRAIFRQLSKAGVPEATQVAVDAFMRGDRAAARRLFEAATVKPENLPGRTLQETGFADSVSEALIGAGTPGEAMYGLDLHDPVSTATAQRDFNLARTAATLSMASGMGQQAAIDQAVKDILGPVVRVSGAPSDGGNVLGVMPEGTDEDLLLTGMNAALADVRKTLTANKALVMGGQKIGQDVANILNATTGYRIDDIMTEGVFRNYGDGWGFFDSYSGRFIGDAAGRPLIWTTRELLDMGAPKPSPAPQVPAQGAPPDLNPRLKDMLGVQ